MMSICFKEGIKIHPEALNDIITGANHDVRQVLHNLSMWSVKDKQLSIERAKEESEKAKKNIKLVGLFLNLKLRNTFKYVFSQLLLS
jgi:replication factor C subunit 1